VDVFQLLGDKVVGTDQEIMEKTIKEGGTAYDAARKVAMKASVVYPLGAASDLVFDPTMYIGIGGISKANQKLLQSGKNAERGGAIISYRNPITGQVRASLDSAPITSRVARAASKMYEASPPKLQSAMAATANAATSAQVFASKFIPHTGDVDVDTSLSMTLNANYNTENILSREFDNARVKRGIVSGSPEDTLNTIVAESTPNLRPFNVLEHGTSEKAKKAIEKTGQFKNAKGSQNYDYSDFGFDSVYFTNSDISKNTPWTGTKAEAASMRSVHYPEKVSAILLPGSKVKTIRSKQELEDLYRLVEEKNKDLKWPYGKPSLSQQDLERGRDIRYNQSAGTARDRLAKEFDAIDINIPSSEDANVANQFVVLNKKRLRVLQKEEVGALGLPEADLKIQVTKSIEENAKKLGMDLPPQRIEALVDDVMDQKRMVKLDNELREELGALSFDKPLNEQMIENYVGHVPDIKNTMARRNMEGADVDDVIDWTAREADKAMTSGGLVTNPEKGLKQRREYSRGMSISEANKKAAADPRLSKIMKRAGTNAWFIESSYKAARMNLQARLKSANSKPLLELLKTKGIKWVPADKKILVRDGKVRQYISGPGSFQLDDSFVKAGPLADPKDFQKRAWAQEAVNKLNYVMSRKEGNFTKMASIYNYVFRKTALAKPGYYLQNWGDALYKNMTQYVRVGDYVDANKVWNGKGMVSIAGKMTPAQTILKEIQELGVVKFSHTSEAVYGATAMGKRLTADGSEMAKRGKWQALNEGIEKYGASGENWSRAALYINRRKQGYSPAQALYDVENIHFNFGRTTQNLDRLRNFFPFIQFPIKSLGIARELTVGRPGVTSQFVQWQDKLDKALNDPMESGFLYRIQKDYQRIQNSIYVGTADKAFNAYNSFIDDLLGANSWVAKNLISSSPKFANRVLKAAYPDEVYAGLSRYGIKVKFPVGPDALTPWMMWEDAVNKNGGVLSGPLGEAAMMLMTGVDPYTREDLRKGGFSNVLGSTMYSIATGAVVTPSISKVIKQYLSPPDAQYFTPPALAWFKGAFGGQSGFIEIDNVDRMYAFKKRTMMAEYKESISEYNALTKREIINGNANLSWLSGVPATTSLEVFRRIQGQLLDMGATVQLGDVAEAKANPPIVSKLTGKKYPVPDLAQVVADLKGIIETNKELDANYVFMKKEAVKSRTEEREKFMADFENLPPNLENNESVSSEPEDEIDLNDEEESTPVDVEGDDEQDYETE
jgi:hypothetical protein